MAGFAYRDPSIGRAFETLAGVLGGPDPMKIAQASVLGAQRQNYEAQALENHAKADMYGIQNQSVRGLQDILATNPNMSDPMTRAKMAAFASGMPGGLQHGPSGLTGFSTFIQPQAFNENDLSNVLLGTGVVKDFGQTPVGQARDNAALMDRQRLANEGSLAVAGTRAASALDVAKTKEANDAEIAQIRAAGARSMATVAPNTAARLWGAIQNRIAAEAGVDPANLEIPPNVRDDLLGRAAEVYQTTKDATSAVEAAFLAAPKADRTDWGIPLLSTPRASIPQTAAVDVAQGAKKADQIAGSAGVQASRPGANPGAYRNPKTGQTIIFKGGHWVDEKTGEVVK